MSLPSIGATPSPGFTPVGAAQSAPASGTTTTAAQASTAAAPVSTVTTSAPAQAPSMDQLKSVLAEVQKAVTPVAQSLQFTIDQDTGKTVVKVMDTETNKVLRQFPTEEVLAMAKSLDKLQGLLLNQKA